MTARTAAIRAVLVGKLGRQRGVIALMQGHNNIALLTCAACLDHVIGQSMQHRRTIHAVLIWRSLPHKRSGSC